jgi:hypothetical protein
VYSSRCEVSSVHSLLLDSLCNSGHVISLPGVIGADLFSIHQEDCKKLADFQALFGSFSLADKLTNTTEILNPWITEERSSGL